MYKKMSWIIVYLFLFVLNFVLQNSKKTFYDGQRYLKKLVLKQTYNLLAKSISLFEYPASLSYHPTILIKLPVTLVNSASKIQL